MQVKDQDVRVGMPIAYEAENKVMNGIILEIREVDKKDMNAPWARVKENKTGEDRWISLNNWASTQTAPVAPIIEEDDLY
jgi:hypothetical protein